jgi:FtsH-binding integral membrane protein
MNVDTIFSSLRVVHIALGGVALVVAPGAMLVLKGSRRHRQFGKIYFWSMVGVAITAIAMSLLHKGTFLALVGVFAFYLAFIGYRALYRKKPTDRATALDWIVSACMLAAGAWLAASGATALGKSPFGTISLVFGAIAIALALRDFRRYRSPSTDPHAWWFAHMRGMLTAYITTVTAFSAVNFSFLPTVVRWLWPTVAGTVGIFIWIRYYKKRFALKP